MSAKHVKNIMFKNVLFVVNLYLLYYLNPWAKGALHSCNGYRSAHNIAPLFDKDYA